MTEADITYIDAIRIYTGYFFDKCPDLAKFNSRTLSNGFLNKHKPVAEFFNRLLTGKSIQNRFLLGL